MAHEEVFSEQEVTEIIRRATALSEQAAESKPYTPGITRAELARIATEIGVDPACLEQAILESKEKPAKRGFRLTEEFERVVEGEIDPTEFDLVTGFIRTMGRFGPGLSQVGRSVRANAWTGASRARVEVTSRNGRTKVRVESSPILAMIAGGYAIFLGSILTAPMLAEQGQFMLAFLSVFLSVVVGGTLGAVMLRAGHKASRRLADELRDRIAEEIAAKNQTPIENPEDDPVRSNLGSG